MRRRPLQPLQTVLWAILVQYYTRTDSEPNPVLPCGTAALKGLLMYPVGPGKQREVSPVQGDVGSLAAFRALAASIRLLGAAPAIWLAQN